MTSPCARCKRPILWARTRNTNKSIPLDPEPVPGGNVRLEQLLNKAIATVLPKEARKAGEALYISHFATCPFAANFRKR